MCLTKFVDVLEAMPKRSILTPEEKPVADKLFDRVLQIKEFDGRTMMGIEVMVVFMKHRI